MWPLATVLPSPAKSTSDHIVVVNVIPSSTSATVSDVTVAALPVLTTGTAPSLTAGA
jgi:hypothetical protein